MKEKLLEILTKQINKGNAINTRLENISNINELNELILDYEEWDKTNCTILKLAFVQPQLNIIYEGVNYLGNVNTDSNSFKEKRNRINYCLPRKLAHLNTAINQSQISKTIDLLPLDEAIINQTGTLPTINIKMKKVFISHSSEDAEKIKPLADLIEIIGVPYSQIFFSSTPTLGVFLGENIFDRLKQELSENVLALFILSVNFYNSPVCLCEMGAVWIKSNKQIPILIPPFKFEDVKGVFTGTLGFMINDKNRLNSFKTEIESYFNLSSIDLSRWEEKRDEYLTKVNNLISIS